MGGRKQNLIMGGAAGAALVVLLAMLLGELLEELAHPGMVVFFAVFGAILGAYAAGAVAYDREHEPPDPMAGYQRGALAEIEAEEAREAAQEEAREDGLVWLVRRRAGSLLKFPLNPWI